MSDDSRSVVDRPKSESLTTTLRSDLPSGKSIQPSVTIKFSGLISRWKTWWSWHAATASHIWENIDDMSLRRARERSWEGCRVERRLGVGGVRDDETELLAEVGESDS
jgi:hypothetical protein